MRRSHSRMADTKSTNRRLKANQSFTLRQAFLRRVHQGRTKLTRLAQRAFNHKDQVRFASASGDHNPMHVDVLKARRTQAGAPVVHGMNLLLWAFDSLAAATPNLLPLRSFKAQFYNFVHLEEVVHADLTQHEPTRASLTISVDDVARSKITLEFGEAIRTSLDWTSVSLDQIAVSSVALDSTYESMRERSGYLKFILTEQDSDDLFPSATKWLGHRRISAIAATTYLVGMVCPGLHSIYRGLDVEICAESNSPRTLAFRVVRTDERFRLIELEISGGDITGMVRTFARKPPIQQASIASLGNLIRPTEFSGSVALIVGGSRGLGELTAKLIAAGGGRTIITWQTGRDDAERVTQEIRQAGGHCESLAYDSRRSAAEQLAHLEVIPTHAYYFATPAIFRPQSQIFSAERFIDFLSVYVDGFWQLSQALRARQHKLSLFYPSSVSVEERPRGMTEYTMAKSAGETLCADMNAFMPSLRVIVKRLPRLLTDQTASNTAAEATSPIDTMLPIIREVQSS